MGSTPIPGSNTESPYSIPNFLWELKKEGLKETTIVQNYSKALRNLRIVTLETLVLIGYQIFHNYIRPHEALEGKTPVEACGIKIEGKNKWLTLIQKAGHKKTTSNTYY